MFVRLRTLFIIYHMLTSHQLAAAPNPAAYTILILLILMIIMHYISYVLTTFADTPLQTAGPSLKPNTRHAICHFPTVLYIIIISKLMLMLLLLFTIYYDL